MYVNVVILPGNIPKKEEEEKNSPSGGDELSTKEKVPLEYFAINVCPRVT
jgi:hypothetical protein